MNSHSPTTEISNTSDHGYANRSYAQSLEEFGTIRELPGCGGWLLIRPVPNAMGWDGMGCYPLFSCRNWNALRDDLEALAENLVCVWLVTDPFADIAISQLQAAFPDVCYAYKQHFITDLSRPLESVVKNQHRRNVRKAMQLDRRLSIRPGR